MRALVIGSNGYIGKHLAFYLRENGWDVVGADLSEESAVEGLSYVKLDVRDMAGWDQVDTRVDFIFYFSGVTGTTKAYDDIDRYIDVNEKGLLNLLNVMRADNSRARVVFPSTRLVYKGVKDVKLREDSEKEFKSVYALNKWFGENILNQYWTYFGIPFTIYRVCIPYGSFLGGNYSYGTIGFFLSKAQMGQPIPLFGDGEQKRTFTHIEDICRQVFYSLQDAGSENQVYNIGGEVFSLKEVAEGIGDKYSSEVVYVPWPVLDEKIESGDTIFDSFAIDSLLRKPLKNHFTEWLNTIK